MSVLKIISGGQTGADQGGLNAAIKLGLEHGGWCPKGRRSEKGPIDSKYKLQEHPSSQYPPRTEANVKDSDATVIFSKQIPMGAGSKLTLRLCHEHKKPVCWLTMVSSGSDVQVLKTFLANHSIEVLNVAGSRESKWPGISSYVESVLSAAISGRDIALTSLV
jgi:hypothetical protein